ncbi:glycosyl transferase family 51 [Pseudopedobacter saltans DSM 12145]|uniref:Glycosyl transferase family 51 n=1 Tax=Pseudopedobacter saltans (strain ATCC 51119 / DSM 12145 / JCM 21818 / CCUG 39354 / LMG 10337 / NBRC 100064 / NCIMB 13643) TaxID=762903 RepID=F0S9H9_PSESL|nr:biosynthetic peptidoglycan transglycosylase [Pseudopedobacter saltans]ADY53532.1 glycosyl transferase family 51 [Pseudopedobacter saltans DSM 12145]
MSSFFSRSGLRKFKKPLIIGLSIVVGLFLCVGTYAYLKRETLLNKAVSKAIVLAKSQYNLNVNFGHYGFSGFSAVNFKQITVVPEDRDSLAKIDDLTVDVKLFPLIFGKIKIAELYLNNGNINLVKKDSISNYDFLFRKDSSKKSDNKEVDFAGFVNKLVHQVLDKIPEDMAVRNFNISYKSDTSSVTIFTPEAKIINKELFSKIEINGKAAVWHVNGFVDPSDERIDLKLFAENNKVELPILEQKYGLKLNFDTVETVLKSVRKHGKTLDIEGNWSIKNLLINHPKISSDNVIVPNASVDAKFIIGKDFFSIDSSTVVKAGLAEFNPFVKITLRPHKTYALKLNIPQQKAQNILDAFPVGLFESLEGLKVAGDIGYNLDFYFDTKLPDSVTLNSTLSPSKDFRIVQYGKTNLQKINGDFVYTPYEKGKPVRDILVSDANPNFVHLENISPNLKNALLTAEDPSFFSHRGFVEKSIKQSITTNFKSKSFKRGGSTISMQLVKNVFLNRNKTIARKVEEMLIVWLIENQKLSTKSRMFEVYLNIIEWGRNIYGIKEAANYYFGKYPSDLSVGESIYLASIVPKPKSSLYAWQSDGSLKPYLHGYFNLIGKLMAMKGYVERDSSSYGFYGVRLRESLRQQIAPADSLATDSLNEDSDEDIFKFFNIKKDSVTQAALKLKEIFGGKKDTIEKSAKELRQERRQKRREARNKE